ncbi:L,D-transpeptidase [Ancylobacter dichloromethanicus]|uniref:L,D-transpeptidase n=1 Tax=Ancylobacter dichloromethanicus TaxID=518825 RepID=A0A9W6J6J4_9HYPH|nr:L,D-transpeptidase [Ancylobacter dichloromethanicus]MBS7553013.1 L,D-transpeptidase [Ancylobacter dichloromethanicus]GLK70334.1 L,D-transpeptidase [Ancylobacter dichloromethanicus]
MGLTMRLKTMAALALAAVTLAGTAPAMAQSSTTPSFFSFFPRPSNFGNGPVKGYSSVRRQVVPYSGKYKPGTVVVNTAERRLYLVQDNGTALKYGIGVGRDGFRWGGIKTITRKAEWPGWTPPPQMLKRRPDLPRYMPGGIDNPLGARALYLGSTLYRIHGSNEPETIGQAVSSGCFRMTNDDVTDLYNRVRVGTQVVVLN